MVSAPRVPAGWTREAADLVWEDWWRRALGCTAIIMVNDPRPLGEIEDLLEDDRLLAEDILVATSLVGRLSGGLDNTIMDSGEILVAWRSAGDAMRAWAAVGAPVLAPAEDGKPSLAEWVAAAEGSALGRPLTWWDDGALEGGLDLAAEFPGRVVVYLGPGTKPCVEVQGEMRWEAIATPAELRALLDRLAAAEARP